MAPRHLVFVQGYQDLDLEQRMALAKIVQFSPPIALANSSLDQFTKDVFPGVVEYVHREYEVGGSFEEDGDRYLILVRRDKSRIRLYGEEVWPCSR